MFAHSPRIAFLGIGLMGTPMTRNLLDAGFSMTLWNRTTSKCEPFASEATIAGTPAEAVAEADIVIAMLENGHCFQALEIDACLDCGIPESLLSTNRILLKRRNDNDIHNTAIIKNSHLSHCTISKNCYIENSKMENVIMLAGSKVLHQNIENTIVGFNEVIECKGLKK